MSDVIQARELSKWFGEVVAVNNIDLTIGEGVTGLLGPNGAGKSTVIRLVLGLYAPSRGSIRVFGADPRNDLDVLGQVGYCPELEGFFDGMSGYEFVWWLNRYRGMTRRDAKQAALTVCAQVEMTARMHDPIDSYSQGMRQRIRIAQALVGNPALVILDEPMAGLDPEGREDMFALIRRMGEQGQTVIVSSHVLYEIERVTNNVVLLHSGRVLANGPVQEIRQLIDEHPHTVTVASTDNRRVAGAFVTDTNTLSVEFEDNRVIIRTADPNGFYERLNKLAVEDGLELNEIRCADDNLQAVFDYLVKG